MRGTVLALFIAWTLAGCAEFGFAVADEPAAIRAVLLAQQEAWNRGDIDAFMAGYWNSPELRFVSGDKITKGWAETLARYKTRYDTRDKMGHLDFSDVTVDMLGSNAALVVGHWRLTHAGDTPGGVFSLTFRKMDGAWVIVLDHTS